jgi:hypothetical protein
MNSPATNIAHALVDNAEAVCRRYLSKGHREGRYWLVGDAHNTPGRSLYVRLVASPDSRPIRNRPPRPIGNRRVVLSGTGSVRKPAEICAKAALL